MKAFNGNPELKTALIACATAHQKADEYEAGTYGRESKKGLRACSIGCTTRDVNILLGTGIPQDDHAGLSESLGIPVFVPRLADSIFEGLPISMRPAWTARWLSAIPEGADLSPALPRFLMRLLDLLPEQDRSDVVDSISVVKDVLRAWAETGAVDRAAANVAANVAADAANAAYAAANAAYAASRAAYAAANAAADAAYAAYAASRAANAANAAYAAYAASRAAYAAADAAKGNIWPQIADALIMSMEEARK